jgi:hypothetical protein
MSVPSNFDDLGGRLLVNLLLMEDALFIEYSKRILQAGDKVGCQ